MQWQAGDKRPRPDDYSTAGAYGAGAVAMAQPRQPYGETATYGNGYASNMAQAPGAAGYTTGYGGSGRAVDGGGVGGGPMAMGYGGGAAAAMGYANSGAGGVMGGYGGGMGPGYGGQHQVAGAGGAGYGGGQAPGVGMGPAPPSYNAVGAQYTGGAAAVGGAGASPGEPLFPAVKLRGLPFGVSESDIRTFVVGRSFCLGAVLHRVSSAHNTAPDSVHETEQCRLPPWAAWDGSPAVSICWASSCTRSCFVLGPRILPGLLIAARH